MRLTLLLLAIAFHSNCLAASWVSGANDGVAIQGYDPVAYFIQKAPVKGSPKFTHDYGGTVWFFSTAENRETFAAAPEKYLPQYGGHCALAVANGKASKGSGEAWTMREGKLYLNADKDVQARWLRSASQNIYFADREWPGLKANLERR